MRMKLSTVVLSTIILVLALTFAPGAAPAAEHAPAAKDAPVAPAAEDAYALNPGDVLEVSVWKEEGMQRDVLVLPDGRISFPLAGHIQAAGKSAEQVEKILAQRLKRYFPDPVITVTVKSVGGYAIFVIGQVQQSGRFPLSQPTDVLQALSLAGGFTEFADEEDIKILRREGGKQSILPFDYSDVEKGRNLDSNILLRSGDVVVVPTEGLF